VNRNRLTVTNTTNILVRENGILVEVSKTTSLLNQGGGKAVSVRLVVGELGRDVVVDLEEVQSDISNLS
jgi:hypothetical protein